MNKIVITGGAGFIGTNLALNLVKDNANHIIIFDNLSRAGAEKNLEFLLSKNYKNLQFFKGDVRDFKSLKEIVKDAKIVFHLAAQVAVTSSVEEPLKDFEINAMGTLYILEAIRKVSPDAIIVFASTNKVYGELKHLKLKETKTRYVFAEMKNGISEKENLDFHSPYGVSKGCADQYVRDYYRIYGLKTVVFRQSCIYGAHQHGNEDQGWVAHFIIRSLMGKSINIYGDGKQVRDLLEVRDLIRAYKTAIKKIELVKGEIFNIGGGKNNSFSLLELIEFLSKELNRKIDYNFYPWRPGDQKVFISDNRRIKKLLGWEPEISTEKGIKGLICWLRKFRIDEKGK
ncbi:MAG: GDP-mannose 4,6-dehydratase [Candidatus Omnitrophica bacterium]|nr:GDP-mannose 4,6-dehydratase [Candidatus Omnitrophota bacterium]